MAIEAKGSRTVEDLTGIRERKNQQPRDKTERRVSNGSTSLTVSPERSRRANSWSFYQLRSFLEYKGIKYEVGVIAVPLAYTSQTCHQCLHIGLRCG